MTNWGGFKKLGNYQKKLSWELQKEVDKRIKMGGGDAVEWMQNFEDNSVDLMITDVPYESLEKWRKIGTTTRLQSKWFEIFPYSRFDELFTEMYRVMKKNSHLYFFSDWDTLRPAEDAARKAGFTVWPALIWQKKVMGMGYHYRSTYEFIMFFEKGKRKLKDLGISNVLEFSPGEVPEFENLEASKVLGTLIEEKRVKSIYPTTKPVRLMKTLIEQSSDVGQVVCDPFMGTGPVGYAAFELDRIFWGNDLSIEMVTLVESELEARIAKSLKEKEKEELKAYIQKAGKKQ